MDVGTAFLLGVIVGHWLLLFALWRASLKLVQMLASLRENDPRSNPSKVLILPPVDGTEQD